MSYRDHLDEETRKLLEELDAGSSITKPSVVGFEDYKSFDSLNTPSDSSDDDIDGLLNNYLSVSNNQLSTYVDDFDDLVTINVGIEAPASGKERELDFDLDEVDLGFEVEVSDVSDRELLGSVVLEDVSPVAKPLTSLIGIIDEFDHSDILTMPSVEVTSTDLIEKKLSEITHTLVPLSVEPDVLDVSDVASEQESESEVLVNNEEDHIIKEKKPQMTDIFAAALKENEVVNARLREEEALKKKADDHARHQQEIKKREREQKIAALQEKQERMNRVRMAKQQAEAKAKKALEERERTQQRLSRPFTSKPFPVDVKKMSSLVYCPLFTKSSQKPSQTVVPARQTTQEVTISVASDFLGLNAKLVTSLTLHCDVPRQSSFMARFERLTELIIDGVSIVEVESMLKESSFSLQSLSVKNASLVSFDGIATLKCMQKLNAVTLEDVKQVRLGTLMDLPLSSLTFIRADAPYFEQNGRIAQQLTHIKCVECELPVIEVKPHAMLRSFTVERCAARRISFNTGSLSELQMLNVSDNPLPIECLFDMCRALGPFSLRQLSVEGISGTNQTVKEVLCGYFSQLTHLNNRVVSVDNNIAVIRARTSVLNYNKLKRAEEINFSRVRCIDFVHNAGAFFIRFAEDQVQKRARKAALERVIEYCKLYQSAVATKVLSQFVENIWLPSYRGHRNWAATTIQRVFRGYVIRKRYGKTASDDLDLDLDLDLDFDFDIDAVTENKTFDLDDFDLPELPKVRSIPVFSEISFEAPVTPSTHRSSVDEENLRSIENDIIARIRPVLPNAPSYDDLESIASLSSHQSAMTDEIPQVRISNRKEEVNPYVSEALTAAAKDWQFDDDPEVMRAYYQRNRRYKKFTNKDKKNRAMRDPVKRFTVLQKKLLKQNRPVAELSHLNSSVFDVESSPNSSNLNNSDHPTRNLVTKRKKQMNMNVTSIQWD
ncbi:hypothetical protein PCE1_001242 [Barthelona sp. PCE]